MQRILFIWDYEDKMCYTVKSGYRLLMGYKDEEISQQDGEHAEQRAKLIQF